MIQDWMLERYRLNELAPAERAEVDRALAADPQVRARLDALEADSQETLIRFTPRAVATEVQRRSSAPRPERRAFFPVPALALAAVVLLGVVTVVLTRRPPVDDILVKGAGPTLRVFRQTAAEPQRLFDGAKVRAHERVQVSFDLAGQRSLVVVSIDGAGGATLHFPTDGSSVAPAGFKALPESFELDEAPGYERFFLVTANQPLDAAEILQKAQALARQPDARTAPLPLPESLTQRSLMLLKESP